MKRIVPKDLNSTTFANPSPIKWLFGFLFALCFSFTAVAQQCGIGPYQVFESFGASPSTSGTATSPAAFTNLNQGGTWYGSGITSSTTIGYSGKVGLSFNSVSDTGSYLITPLITSPNNKTITLSFFFRSSSSVNNAGVRVEYATPGAVGPNYTPGPGAAFNPYLYGGTGVNWIPITSTNNPAYSSASTSLYKDFFTGTFTPGSTGVYIKITRNNTGSGGGVLNIDDLSWFSSDSTENYSTSSASTAFVLPRQNTQAILNSSTGTSSVCSGTTYSYTLETNAKYKFYDNGGINDNYGATIAPATLQDVTVTFKPATGQNIKLTFNNPSNTNIFNVTSTATITVTGDSSKTSGTPQNGVAFDGKVAITNSVFTSTNCDGSISVRFQTTGNTGAGFDITVESYTAGSSCSPPSALAVTSSSITQTSASFTWTAPLCPPTTGYDYYITTNATPTLPTTTTAVTNSGTTALIVGTTNVSSLVITNLLAPGTTYYAYIRSNCSTGNYSNWTSYVTFSTPCSPITVPPTYLLDFEGSNSSPYQNCTTVLNGAYGSYIGTNNYIFSSGSTAGSWYVLTPFTLSNLNAYSLTFQYATSAGAGNSSSFQVFYVSTTSAITTALFTGGTQTQLTSGPVTTTSNTFQTTPAYTFTPPTTGTYYIGIYYSSNLNGANLLLDNIKLEQVCNNNTWDWNPISSSYQWSGNAIPTSSDNLIFNASYTGAGNTTLLGCACTVNNGAVVTFNSNDVLSLQNIVTVNSGGQLIFNNNSSLVQTTTSSNAGNITYYRDTKPVRKYDYTYWSSPVSGCLLQSVSPNTGTNVFFQYSGLIQNWQYVDPTSTIMGIGQGYIIRAPNSFATSGAGSIYTAPFTGVPNNGDKQVLIYGNNSLNLIGNPYPSAISAASLVAFPNDLILGGTLWFWTHSYDISSGQYNSADYATWNSIGGTSTSTLGTLAGANTSASNGKIAAGQAFFVKGINSTNINMTFKNSMRLSGNSDNNSLNFYRNATTQNQNLEQPKSRVWLDVSNNQGAFKQLLVGYTEGATADIDRLYDGEFVDVGLPMVIYTKVAETKLTIQGVGYPFHDTDTFPIIYKSTIDGTFTISLNNFDGLFTNQNIYLEDTLLHTITDLKQSVYTFTTAVGTFENRFVLRFNINAALTVNHATFDANTIVVYKNQDGLHINSGVIDMDKVKIYDLSGRLITEKDAIQAVDTIFTNVPASPQILLVQITSIDGVTVTKKIGY